MTIRHPPVLLPIILASLIACKTKEEETISPFSEWNYENTDWKKQGYTECGEKIQSPIDINTSLSVKANIENIFFQYNIFTMSPINRGHTIQVTLKTSSSLIMLRGITFTLIQSIKNQETPVSISINIADIIPQNTNYYTYTGSLTTPPCTQGVQWIIFKEPMNISTQQVNIFEKIFPHGNARPLQLLHNRIILEKI